MEHVCLCVLQGLQQLREAKSRKSCVSPLPPQLQARDLFNLL